MRCVDAGVEDILDELEGRFFISAELGEGGSLC